MIKKRILHIQLLPLMSGVQRMMLLLLDSLDKEEYEFFVLSKPGGPLIKKLEESGYRYLPVNSLRRSLSLWDLVAFVNIYLLCKRYKFDIVHTHSSKTGFLGRIAARLAGVPKIIHTVHGFPYHSHQPFYARYLYMFLESIAGHFCDKIVIVNEFERYEAKRKRIIQAYKMQTIYNGINVDPKVKFRKYGGDGLLIKPAKTMSELRDSFVIGTIARFTTAKNIVNLTKIAVRVCLRNPTIKFVFVGDGELFETCSKIVSDAQMEGRIILPGWQTNIEEWLVNFEVFCLFSYWEGLSISILEAMSWCLPVIASSIKGNNEIVTRDTGLLLDVDNHEEVIDTLVSLPHRPNDLNNWSKNTLTRIEENFSLQQFVKQYKSLYDRDVRAMKRNS